MNLETLATYFTDKLNANSVDELFVAGYLIQTSGTEYKFSTFPNYFTEVENVYTPAMFSFIGDPQKVPNQDITNFNIILEFVLTGDSEQDPIIINQQAAIEEFRLGIVNNPTDTLDGYKLVSSASPITTESLNDRSAKKRIRVSMELAVTTGVNIWFGNDVTTTLSLSGNTANNVFAISKSIINGKTEETESDLTENDARTKTVARDGTARYDMSFIFDNSDILNEVVKDVSNFGGSVNKKYDLVFTFPQFTLTKSVIVSGGTVSLNANDLIIVNAQFTETV